MNLKRLHDALLSFGKPLSQPIYCNKGQLLANTGMVIDDEELYRELLDFGYVVAEDEEKDDTQAEQSVTSAMDYGVLIADDTPLMLDTLENHLKAIGFIRILRANDGEIAMAKVGRYRPEVVFLDIDMPRRNGLEALEILREEFPDLFICMLSAHSSLDNVRTALSKGASGFLVKPYQRTRLEHILNQFLSTQNAALEIA
ncbi:response regulator transcription factor [endosymbiont of Ridgeia piscesae]|uniref:Response regulator receiver domain n=1 Tax=endosymbiont of Ridgeia piscesae TaxID=54398 RepID=A0A0T5YT78_9GAMM|nr:response regulator [endosymbiont of Ridgeia piscesae]KRT53654.1 Response regulator receiver domain [endosymbiont of Ridgeia piscesae]KRT57002.1 Response regulator receiver domain-containing protein [endosymbiont of Ridgeia piscesae]